MVLSALGLSGPLLRAGMVAAALMAVLLIVEGYIDRREDAAVAERDARAAVATQEAAREIREIEDEVGRNFGDAAIDERLRRGEYFGAPIPGFAAPHSGDDATATERFAPSPHEAAHIGASDAVRGPDTVGDHVRAWASARDYTAITIIATVIAVLLLWRSSASQRVPPAHPLFGRRSTTSVAGDLFAKSVAMATGGALLLLWQHHVSLSEVKIWRTHIDARVSRLETETGRLSISLEIDQRSRRRHSETSTGLTQ